MAYVPTTNKGIYDIVSNKEWLYYRPRFEMKGWHKFCSGAVVAGITANARPSTRGVKQRREYLDRQLLNYGGTFDGLNSIKEYFDRANTVRGQGHFDIPIEYAHAFLLERLYYKHTDGRGGTDMWGHNAYKSKTFVLADSARDDPHVVCVTTFCKWLESLGPIVNVTRHGPVDGAHGGVCTSWLVDLNPALTQDYLRYLKSNLNDHLKYLDEYRQRLINKGRKPEHITENEQIQQMWVNEEVANV